MIKKLTLVISMILIMVIEIPKAINAEWRENDIGWCYQQGSSHATGWKYIENKWYYFDRDGYMKTGWVKDGDNWYFLSGDGSMVTNTIVDSFLVDDSGAWVKTDKWKNKIYNALGDSITKGINPSNHYQVMSGNRYTDVLERCLSLSEVNNYGIEGTTIVHEYDNNGMIDRYESMSNDADLISVFGGTNDFSANVPMGSIDSGNNNEFKCAFNNLIKGLIQRYSSKKIFVITPLPRQDEKVANANGYVLQDYVNAEIEICNRYGIPVLNLYNGELGINAENESDRDTYIPDGIHPNINGSYVLSTKLLQFINKL